MINTDKLRVLREKKKMSQYEFAELIGVSQPYLCQLENGTRDPSMKMLKKIAKATETPISKLIS